MKSKLLISLLTGFTSLLCQAQLPVSTTQQNKKVILEEYTGIYCQFCSDGHKMADELVKANIGNAFVINVHVGGYAIPKAGDPNFQTPFGTGLVGQIGIVGYPAGTVNRHLFSGLSQGTGTAMSRGDFATTANQILAQASYLNVALQGNINPNTRTLTVDVEVYYTNNSPQATNFLNVVLIQDSILGPQTGGSTYYPAMMVGGKYQHNKLLRHMLSNQWGEKISTTTKGSKFSKQFTYTIPTELPATITAGTLKTNVLLSKLRVIAFVTETQQEIVSGNTGPITISTPTGVSNNISDSEFSIYPNPSTGYSTIALTLKKKEVVKIKMYNVLGNEVLSSVSTYNTGSHQINLDYPALPQGLYFIKLYIGNNEQTQKITISK